MRLRSFFEDKPWVFGSVALAVALATEHEFPLVGIHGYPGTHKTMAMEHFHHKTGAAYWSHGSMYQWLTQEGDAPVSWEIIKEVVPAEVLEMVNCDYARGVWEQGHGCLTLLSLFIFMSRNTHSPLLLVDGFGQSIHIGYRRSVMEEVVERLIERQQAMIMTVSGPSMWTICRIHGQTIENTYQDGKGIVSSVEDED